MKKNSESVGNLRIFHAAIVIVLICIIVWIVKKRQQLSPIVLNDYTVEFYNDGTKIPDDQNKYYCVVKLLPNVMKENVKKSKAYTWQFIAHSDKEFNKVHFKFKDTKWQQKFSFEDRDLSFGDDVKYQYNKETTTMIIESTSGGKGKEFTVYVNDDDAFSCGENEYNNTMGDCA